jgi:hypothetical protein
MTRRPLAPMLYEILGWGLFVVVLLVFRLKGWFA